MTNNLERMFSEIIGFGTDEQDAIAKLLQDYISSDSTLKHTIEQPAHNYRRVVEMGLLTKKMIGPFAKSLLIESPDGIYAVDPEDYEVGWKLRANGSFGSEQVAVLKNLIDIESRILIVGAHIGTLAIPLARICSYIAAVEANPDTYRLLQLNIKLNDLKNCEAFNIAANDKSENINFLLNRSNSGGSKRKPLVDQYIYNYDNPAEIVIPGVPLDAYFTGYTFDAIIMDIEGSEYFALKGMQELLSTSKVLILEFLPHHFRNVSGATMEELLDILPPYQSLTIPSLGKTVKADEFLDMLNFMYDHDMGDDGIIFERS